MSDLKKPKWQRMQERAEKQVTQDAKQKLEKLFSASAKSAPSEWDRLMNLKGSSTYYSEMANYVQREGIPRDWGQLLVLLDHREPTIVSQTLNALQSIAPLRSLAEQSMLAKKLAVLEVSTFDSTVSSAIGVLKKSLLRA
jgi:hypothetical protein